MYESKTFDAEIEKTQSMMEDMQSKLEASTEVLETNAEDFVKSYVQKGGQ